MSSTYYKKGVIISDQEQKEKAAKTIKLIVEELPEEARLYQVILDILELAKEELHCAKIKLD